MYWDYYTEQYNGVPRWGWGLISIIACLLVFIAIIGLLSCMSPKKKDQKGDEEAGVKVPTTAPPQTPSPTPQFPRDKALPPPVPSETSEIPVLK